MSTINQKLGLKPKSRTRQATHGSGLVSNARCPECGCAHVVEHRLNGVLKRLCGSCSHIWIPEA